MIHYTQICLLKKSHKKGQVVDSYTLKADLSSAVNLKVKNVLTNIDTGTIDVEEMVEIVGNLYEMEGVSKVGIDDAIVDTNNLSSKDTAMDRATTVFKMLDVNADGELNEDEFVYGCIEDQNLINLLNSGNKSDRRLSLSGEM